MNRILIFLFFITTAFTANSQSIDWLITGGGPLSDKATSIATDTSGNTYITGYFNEEGTFGPFYIPMVNPSSKEIFVAKIDPQGNYLWVKSGSNYFDDRGLGICLDSMGNVFVTGTCWGGLTFGTLSVYNSSAYTDQIFVLKLDTNGNEIWLKNAGIDESGYPYNDDHGYDLVSGNNGDIFITGFLSNQDPTAHFAIFDNIQVTVPPFDSLAFIAKLSNAGVWQWVRTNEGVNGYRDNRITVDDENNVYVTGGFEGTKTFGTTNLTSFGSSDIYVVKYDNSGSFIFAKQAGSPLEDRGNDIAFDHKDHLYITGEFKAKAAFDTDTINNYGSDEDRDIFVARMSKTGVWDWAKKAGSNSGGDRGNGIVVNNSGNIFVTGQFKDSAKFGGSLEINAGIDSIQVFVAAIDSLGKWRWVMQGGGPDSDRGNGIACDNNCNVYVDGYYSSTILFNTSTITSTGGKDAFTLKVQNACFTYDSPVPPPPPDIISGISPSNVFSPNDDGVNDVFKIASQNIALLNCKIYDRWGILVEELSKLNEGWDGRSTSGLECSVGVYYYVIAAKDNNGKDFNEKGFLQLLR